MLLICLLLQIFGLGMGYLLIKRIKRQREKRDAEEKKKKQEQEKRRLAKERRKQKEDEQKLISGSSAHLAAEDPVQEGGQEAEDRRLSGPELDLDSPSASKASLLKTSHHSGSSQASLDQEAGNITPVDQM